MTLADRDQRIEAFPAYAANQLFAIRDCLGRTERSFQNSYSHRFHTEIQLLRANAVSIVNRKSGVQFVVNGRSKLLQCPGCARMGSKIEVGKSSRSYFHDDKHIEDLKASRQSYKEIASQHGLRVIADKSHPSLGRIRAPSAAVWILQQISIRGTSIWRKIPFVIGLELRQLLASSGLITCP